ncbi:MAG: FecR domain-containing protein [Bacteroidota bacterium]|nr:FecR domain-containing protein [Bacteroidota bacterium]
MDREQIITILHKSLNGSGLTETEKKDLDDWIAHSEHNRRLYEEIMNSDSFHQDVKQMLAYDGKVIWEKVSKELPVKKNRIISILHNPIFWTAAAAILLILISTATYYMFINPAHDTQHPVSRIQQPVAPDVAPGMEKAILTLADGTTVVLDTASNGKIAQQGNTTVLKEDGLLAYNADKNKPQSGTYYNTITTPKSTYYSSLVLADGSKVWLNSLSSIRFPTAFTDKKRVVEITGEAYFEVAKNTAKPFIVNVKDKGMTVEVLGTHFNVNAYNDESAVKTTLLEGAVKIVAGGKTGFLRPGQQGEVLRFAQDDEGVIKIINDVDIDETVAWKNGVFSFKKQDLETIMRQLSRWYDVQTVFEDKVPGHFGVTNISRNVPLSKLLKALELAGAGHFEIDEAGKKITVRR